MEPARQADEGSGAPTPEELRVTHHVQPCAGPEGPTGQHHPIGSPRLRKQVPDEGQRTVQMIPSIGVIVGTPIGDDDAHAGAGNLAGQRFKSTSLICPTAVPQDNRVGRSGKVGLVDVEQLVAAVRNAFSTDDALAHIAIVALEPFLESRYG